MVDKLVGGCIPAHTECPYKENCDYVEGCHHKGVEHEVPFSCGAARFYRVFKKEKRDE